MRLKKHIPEDELRRLKEKGWSIERLRIHFKVSKSTIKRRLGALAEKKEEKIMMFLNSLEELGRKAPTGFCRAEVLRLASGIRAGIPEAEKKRHIIAAIESGAWTVIDIADECRLTRSETERLLGELVEEKRVGKRMRGGVMNRGRKMKFHYFLI